MAVPAFPRHPLARPLVIGHRGHSAAAPENTMVAFEAAVAAGADMIELDVTLSRDGRLAVIHDETLDRTTDGAGPVSARSLAELRALDAGAWFGPAFAGQRLPLLEEVLEAFGSRVLVNVEIKPEAARVPSPEPAARMVAAMVRDMGLRQRVMVSSFDHAILRQARRADADLHLGVLSNTLAPGVDPADLVRGLGARAWNCRLDLLTRRRADAVHARDALVLVWAPAELNTADSMRRALDLGADGFFANDPALMAAVVASRA